MSKDLNNEPLLVSTDAVFVATLDKLPTEQNELVFIRRIVGEKGYWIEHNGLEGKSGTVEGELIKSLFGEARCNGSIDAVANSYLGLGVAAAIISNLVSYPKSYDQILKNKTTISCKDVIKIGLTTGINYLTTLKEEDADTFCDMCEQDGLQLNVPKKNFQEIITRLNDLIHGVNHLSYNLGRFVHFIEKRRRKIIHDLALKQGGLFIIRQRTLTQIKDEFTK